MSPLRSVYTTSLWHSQALTSTAVASARVAEPALGGPDEVAHLASLSASAEAGEVGSAASGASSSSMRDPAQAPAFCDTFNAGLGLSPSDLTSKVDMMCSSPLKLSRCMPALFMADVLGPYASLAKLSDKPAPVIWINGDSHLGNFGIIESKQGNPVWGLNDFDMAAQGAPYMDLDRLAFSLVSAMRQRGMSDRDTSAVVDTLATSYAHEIKDIAAGRDQGMAYLNAKQASGAIKKLIEKSADVDRSTWLAQYATQARDGGWKFVASDKIKLVDAMTVKRVSDALDSYDQTQGPTSAIARPLQVLDVAQKLESGGSSYGQPRYFALVAGADPKQLPVILEVKQELPPTLVGYTGDDAAAIRSSKPNWTGNLHKADAAQVVAGQLAMGGDQSELSGHTSIDGISYLVRERQPVKASLSDKHLATVDDFTSLADQAGTVLALAHGRSAAQARDIAAWMGDEPAFVEHLDAFAQAYATQAEADLAAYRAAHPQASAEHGSVLTDKQD
jgi:uncharacterized protein (DUF2252 family)